MNPRLWLILLAIPILAIVLFRSIGEPDPAPEAAKAPGSGPSNASIGQEHSTPAISRAKSKIERTSRPGTPSSSPQQQRLDREKFRGYLNGGLEIAQPTAEQLRQHVEANKQSAESLLAAFQSSGDKAWLSNAAALHPDDPRVQFAMVAHGGTEVDKRAWLDHFKATDTENALASYLSAKAHLKAGNIEAGIEDLLAGASKPGFNDYSMHDIQSAEEMYLSAGESPIEAKIKSNIQEKLPHLKELRDLSREVLKLQEAAAGRDDAQTYSDLAQIGIQLGQQMGHTEGVRYILNDLVGIGIQKKLLETLQPDGQYPFLNGTPTEAMAALDARRQLIRDAATGGGNVANASPNDILAYFDRTKVHGELNALQWLANKQANATP
ncbi:MAG: hypothetical protein ACPGVU_00200 [Limisphaerales bacterium]